MLALTRLPVPSVPVNIQLRLRLREDDDLIRFFVAAPARRRASAVKAALRSGSLPPRIACGES